ncbi:MAG TPA: hypothetical protein VMG33_08105 [Steroidobacteraceae bacterium]|nr:hypothetical protein [Steroidobacteraceae bacterium]
MLIRGGCHCGALRFTLEWPGEPATIMARACGCSFCVKHGGVWTSCPQGVLRVSVPPHAALEGYAFGTRTAQFHVCSRCGVVPLVTSRIEGTLYAVVNVNSFEDFARQRLTVAPASFDGEGQGERLARRQRNWIADVRFGAG